jgi:hypothetical protein
VHVPINSFKFFGIELDIYKHNHNPAEDENLQDCYHDGYTEMVITITPEHCFINPNEWRILIVSPVDGRQLIACEGRLFVLTLAPLERYLGFTYDVNYHFQNGCTIGADIIDVATISPLQKERSETLLLRHTKGVVVPESMLFN